MNSTVLINENDELPSWDGRIPTEHCRALANIFNGIMLIKFSSSVSLHKVAALH